jgi:hypothetical protein
MAVPLPLHEARGRKAGAAVAVPADRADRRGRELMVYPGSDGLFAAHADQLNADLADFVQDLNPRTTPDGSAL